jgi:hypothetical protein
VVDGVIVVELALRSARNRTKKTDVQVAHDGVPLGSGTGIETATASGRS